MCDIRYYPFYRIRRVANIQVPYFENSVGEIIILVQVLMSMREMLKKSIEIIKSYLIRLKDIVIIEEEDNDEDDDDDDDNDNDDGGNDDDDTKNNDDNGDDEQKSFIQIQTQNSPKNIKKRKVKRKSKND